jgi:hypothetical protein
MTPRRRAFFVYLLSGALTLLAIETGFRIHAWVSPAPIWIGEDHYPENPRGYFRPCVDKPGVFCPDLDRSSHGCDAPLEPGKGQVLFLGDSFTWGQGVDAKDTFPSRIAFPGRQRRNCGVSAYAIDDVFRKFEEQRARYSPDLVVYALVLNDFGLSPDQSAFDEFAQQNGPSNIEDYMNFRTMNLDSYLASKNHSWIVRLLLETETGAWFYRQSVMREVSRTTIQAYRNAFTDPSSWDHGVAQIRAMAARSDRFLLVVFPLFARLKDYPLEDVHKKIVDEMHRSHIEVLDLLDTFRGMDESKLIVYRTDSHPNDVAHKIAAEAIQKKLQALKWPPY